MTSADRNDLVPAQEKLEWVTPKISKLGAGEARGTGKNPYAGEGDPIDSPYLGPS